MLYRHLSVALIVAAFGCAESPPAPQPSGDQPRVAWTTPGAFARGRVAAGRSAVFGAGGDGKVSAYDRATGKKLWERALVAKTGSVDAAVVGTVLVVGNYGIFGLDPETGDTLWHYVSFNEPELVPFTTNSELVFLGSYAGPFVSALDPRIGGTRWVTTIQPGSTPFPDGRARVNAPAVTATALFASFTYSSFDATFRARGGIAAFDPATGAQRWSRMLPVADTTKATSTMAPAAAGDVVAVTTQDGFVYVLNASDGSTRWTVPPLTLNNPADTPALDERPLGMDARTLVVGSGVGYLTAYDPRDGHRLWQVSAVQGGIVDRIIVDGDIAVVAHYNGAISAFATADGKRLWSVGGTATMGFWEPRLDGGMVFAAGPFSIAAIRAR